MRLVKQTIFICIAAAVLVFISYRQTHKDYYNYLTMSGATPLAIAEKVPSDISLEINGLVKKDYRFSGDALNALATTRIRTREISPEGTFLGAYIHVGIPVFNILEGIAPLKPDHFIFDQPLDILVTFHSDSGKTSCFSFNELIMTDDRFPVTLAFSRKQLLPTAEEVRETYSYNVYKEGITGLRLICPEEPDTARHLDNVIRISYSVISVDETLLPLRKKKFKCKSQTITCIDRKKSFPAIIQGVAGSENKHWIRIGHGHGYDDIATAKGYDLRSFLRINFPFLTSDDFFLFVACDGYRALFSGREIFLTDDGVGMMIVDSLNGQPPLEGYMLAPTKDYFSDRAMWGLARVVWIHRDQLEM